MSVEALTWAWKATGVSPLAKLVLIWLANYAPDDEWHEPDMEPLSAFLGDEHLDFAPALWELHEAGLIERGGGPEVRVIPHLEWLTRRLHGVPVTPRKRREQFVYFLRSRGLIKIGTSRKPTERIKAIRINWPDPIEVLKVVAGDYLSEREYHERFAHLRRTGEWFTESPELLEFIDSLDKALELA